MRRVALVTGSSRGIGAAIAQKLAQDGYAIAVNSHVSTAEGEAVAEQLCAKGLSARYFPADVSTLSGVRELVTSVESALGPVSVLVNNADWFEPSLFIDNDEAYWARSVAVGMMSTIYCVATTYPSMSEAGRGCIVSIAGDSGRVGLSGGVVHSGAMGAVIAMTKSWAREFASSGVRVNAVSPGPIRGTQLYEAIVQSPLAEQLLSEELSSYLGDGEPEDVAEAVSFLVSDRARHITGQTFSVNGGRCFPS